MKKFLSIFKGKSLLVGVISTSVLSSVSAFAAENAVATMMATSFQVIVTDLMASITAIAPIGITIFAAIFCWQKGKAFFSTITK